MGAVYRAEDRLLHRQIAVKIFSPDKAAQPQSLERFRREACLVAALNHPNIVTIYSVEEHEGLHFLTMELIQGKTLAELVPQGGMPLRRFLDIAVPLVEGLESAHKSGIVHRDLKPENVMVNQEGRVKILDFGIAKTEPDAEPTLAEGGAAKKDKLTRTGFRLGTPSYMAPEQILGGLIDHRTDLFSLGVILFQLATGQRPFQGTHTEEVLAAILRDTPPPVSSINPGIPPVLDDLVARCLEKDVSRRTQSARELRQHLQALAMGMSTLRIVPQAAPSRIPGFRWKRPAAVFAVITSLALTLALVAAGPRFTRLLTAPPWAGGSQVPGSRPPGLAVLPLGNFSNEPEYFVDGMTDALISSLSEIQGIRVISRQSVMRYKGSSEPLPGIARDLGVELVVQGSVFRAGNRIRITAQLIRAIPEQQVWARSYERDLKDVLSIQNEVARTVSEEIQIKLGPAAQRRLTTSRAVDPEAYDAYLRGRFAARQRSYARITESLQRFQEALVLDAGFAPAHSALSEALLLAAFYGALPPPDAYRQAREHAKAALEIDPDLAGAHANLGLVQCFADRDWDTAEASFRRAVALNPNNSGVRYQFWLHLTVRGRHKDASEQLRLALELDPLSPAINMNLGMEAYMEGRDEEALRLLKKAQELAPDFHGPYLYMSNLYRRQGKVELAFANFRKTLELRYPEITPQVNRAFAREGREAALAEAAQGLERLSRRRIVPPEDIGRIYLRLGEPEKALDYLEEAYERGFPGALIADSTGGWETLRSQPRFQALLRRMGVGYQDRDELSVQMQGAAGRY